MKILGKVEYKPLTALLSLLQNDDFATGWNRINFMQ